MSQQIINLGAIANDGTGSPLRTGGQDINANFTDLYGRVPDAGDYGAVGDGVADDTSALQAAFTAAGSSRTPLTLAAGSYLVTTQLTVPSHLTLVGARRQSLIVVNSNIQNAMLGETVTDVTIRGVGFQGPGTNHTDTNTTAAVRFDTTCARIHIEDCDFLKWDDALLLNDCTEVHITGNRFAQCSGGAALMQGVTYSTFANNTWNGDRTGVGDAISGQSFLAIAKSPTVSTFSHHLAVTGNTGTLFSADAFFCQGYHCVFTGNTVDTVENGFTLQAGFTETVAQPVTGGSYNAVTGNNVYTATSCGVLIQPSPGNSLSAHHNVVSGNVFEACEFGVQLAKDAFENTITGNLVLNPTSHGVLFVSGATPSRNTITGNTVSGSGATGILLQGTPVGNSVAGNTVYASKDDGIKVAGGSDNSIVGNVCQDNDSATQGSRFGINVTGGSRCTVKDNKCFCSDTSHFQTRGVNIGASAADTDCVGNDCRNNKTTTNGLADAGTRTYARGNQRVAGGSLSGRAVLSGGTVTVSTTEILAGDSVLLTRVAGSGTAGILTLGAISANTSFVIGSSSGTDAATVFWEIVH